MIERILIIPFLEEIITTGKLEKTRDDENGTSYQISLSIKNEVFSIIIIRTNKSYLLLSCFRNLNYKKKTCLNL